MKTKFAYLEQAKVAKVGEREIPDELADDEILPHVVEALGRRSPYYAQAQMQFDSTDIESAAATQATAQRLLSELLVVSS